MLSFRRMLILLIAVTAAILLSQAPELSQQYRQNLVASIDELTILIQDFDQQANHNGLERQAALNIYATSSEGGVRTQGEEMQRTFGRYQSLTGQLEELTAASPILQPLVVLRRADPATLSKTWQDFVPGVPVSVAGAIWALIGLTAGFAIALVFGAVVIAGARLGQGRRRRGSYPAEALR
jgi:hypothetical protein